MLTTEQPCKNGKGKKKDKKDDKWRDKSWHGNDQREVVAVYV